MNINPKPIVRTHPRIMTFSVTAFLRHLVSVFRVVLSGFSAMVVFSRTVNISRTLFTLCARPIFKSRTERITMIIASVSRTVMGAFFMSFPATMQVRFTFQPSVIVRMVVQRQFVQRTFYTFFFRSTPELVMVSPRGISNVVFSRFRFQLHVFQ